MHGVRATQTWMTHVMSLRVVTCMAMNCLDIMVQISLHILVSRLHKKKLAATCVISFSFSSSQWIHQNKKRDPFQLSCMSSPMLYQWVRAVKKLTMEAKAMILRAHSADLPSKIQINRRRGKSSNERGNPMTVSEWVAQPRKGQHWHCCRLGPRC